MNHVVDINWDDIYQQIEDMPSYKTKRQAYKMTPEVMEFIDRCKQKSFSGAVISVLLEQMLGIKISRSCINEYWMMKKFQEDGK